MKKTKRESRPKDIENLIVYNKDGSQISGKNYINAYFGNDHLVI